MNTYHFDNISDNFKKYVIEELDNKRKIILNFFEVEDNPNYIFNVYVYKTQKDLVEGLRKRGFSKDPDHMCACSKDEDNSLNYFEPLENPNNPNNEWSKKEYIESNIIFHEEIHGIQNYIYGIQPEWLTEGIAKYLDGHYSKGIKYLIENYIDISKTPTMYELKYEFGFHQDEYDAYDYAYIIVSYLIETSGKSNFVKNIHDNKYIEELENNNIVLIALNYYLEKYNIKDIKGENYGKKRI